MEHAALQEIISLAASSQEAPKTDIPVAVVPKGCDLQSLERYQLKASAFRGLMKTTCMSNYAAYVESAVQQGGSDLVTFVNPDSMTAETFFDVGTIKAPGKAEHRAGLGLEKTAPYTALLGINGSPLNQKQLTEWLEDWLPHVHSIKGEGDKELTPNQAIHSIRNMTIEAKAKTEHNEGNMRSSRSAMEEVEANSKGVLPEYFTFKCTPYRGLEGRDFLVRISVLTGDDKPRLKLRICALESAQEEMADEFRSKLQQFLSANSTVYIGSFNPGK